MNDLLNNLKKFKSTDEAINVNDCLNNKNVKLNPMEKDIVPPADNYYLEKIAPSKIEVIPEKIKSEENVKKDVKENEKEDLKHIQPDVNDAKLRSVPGAKNIPPKRGFKIRRAIIYKTQKKK